MSTDTSRQDGAASGIGAGVARALAAAGAAVAVNFVARPEQADAVVREIRGVGGDAMAVRADVSREDDVRAMFATVREAWDGLDILVCNAGIQQDAPITEMTVAQWNAVIGVNLTGATFMVREVVAKMVETDSRPGVIVNMSSLARYGNRGQSNYVSAKAALAANTVTWAREFGAFGIRVGAVAPGMVDTPMTRGMNQKARDALVAAIPVGRIGLPEDIWLAVKFIVECDYFNGRTIDVDGGLIM